MKKATPSRLLRILSVILAIVSFLVLPASGRAQEESTLPPEKTFVLLQELAAAPDREAAFAELSPREQQAVIKYLTSGTLVTIPLENHSDFSVAGETCITRGVAAIYYVANGAAWEYVHWIRACYNGSRITWWTTWREIAVAWWAVGWEFVGDIENTSYLGPNASNIYAYRQGHFRWCVASLGCFTNVYPWSWHRVHADGRWYYGMGGT